VRLVKGNSVAHISDFIYIMSELFEGREQFSKNKNLTEQNKQIFWRYISKQSLDETEKYVPNDYPDHVIKEVLEIYLHVKHLNNIETFDDIFQQIREMKRIIEISDTPKPVNEDTLALEDTIPQVRPPETKMKIESIVKKRNGVSEKLMQLVKDTCDVLGLESNTIDIETKLINAFIINTNTLKEFEHLLGNIGIGPVIVETMMKIFGKSTQKYEENTTSML